MARPVCKALKAIRAQLDSKVCKDCPVRKDRPALPALQASKARRVIQALSDRPALKGRKVCRAPQVLRARAGRPAHQALPDRKGCKGLRDRQVPIQPCRDQRDQLGRLVQQGQSV